MTAVGEFIDIRVDMAVNPPIVTITGSTRGLLYEGPLPPFGAQLPSATQRMPGVDFDVAFQFHHAQIGEIRWTMHVRDGIEVGNPDTPARHAQVSMPYSWALGILYDGLPWAECLDAATSIADYEMLSCLSGIVYGPGAARFGTIEREALAALAAWSQSSD